MIPIELGFMRHDPKNPQIGQELVDWAMAHGVNHFEQCAFYLNWHCEEYMYSLLEKYPRESYYVCGKMPIHNVVTHTPFEKVYADELAKVPGHYFDTYIIQAVDDRATIELATRGIVPFLMKEKEKGNIKRLGISIQCLPETFKKYLDLKCWDVVQMPINYYDWFLCRYDENYQLACEYNVPIIAQAPVKGGLLVKSIEDSNFENFNRNSLQASFDFFASLDNIEMILCGNSTLNSFKETYDAIQNMSNTIPQEYYAKVLHNFAKTQVIDCFNCGKCVEACHFHLPISAYIQLYNRGLFDKTYFTALDLLKNATYEPGNVCNRCGACVEECPRHNDIIHLWGRIFELRT
jgi:predicted aldo/keto reductase-like oxidoreductase